MDKVFQIIFMIIMTVGVIGLPAYYFLNSRRKRIVSEFEEEPENPVGLDSDELDPDDGDFEDKPTANNTDDLADVELNGDITYDLEEDSESADDFDDSDNSDDYDDEKSDNKKQLKFSEALDD